MSESESSRGRAEDAGFTPWQPYTIEETEFSQNLLDERIFFTVYYPIANLLFCRYTNNCSFFRCTIIYYFRNDRSIELNHLFHISTTRM